MQLDIAIVAMQNISVFNDTMQQQIQLNYDQIKTDVQNIVDQEIARIKADPMLQHLIKK